MTLHPIFHDSAHIFGRDPCRRRKVVPLDLMMNENPPGAAVLAEKFRQIKQRSCQAGFDGQKADGGESLVGFPQARGQHGYEVAADFGMLAHALLELLPANETQF